MRKLLFPILLGFAFLICGSAISIASLSSIGFDFTKIQLEEYETKIIQLDDEIRDIQIQCDYSDIILKASEDGSSQVITHGSENGVLVTLEDGTLTVKANESSEGNHLYVMWGDRPEVTVLLPEQKYENLTMHLGSGDVTVQDGFIFYKMDVELGSADFECRDAFVTELKILTGSGDIEISDMNTQAVDLKTGNGKIKVEEMDCEGTLSIQSNNGSVSLKKVVCGEFTLQGTSGNLKMNQLTSTGDWDVRLISGDMEFSECDAENVRIKVTSGDVSGTFLSDKVIHAKAGAGSMDVPDSANGGTCEITTTSGDIEIKIDRKEGK